MVKIMNLRPEFFDIIGIFVFGIIFTIGVWMLFSTDKLPIWTAYLLIIIGIFGLIIDGAIVIKTYLRQN